MCEEYARVRRHFFTFLQYNNVAFHYFRVGNNCFFSITHDGRARRDESFERAKSILRATLLKSPRYSVEDKNSEYDGAVYPLAYYEHSNARSQKNVNERALELA